MTTKTSASTAAARKKLHDRIAAAQKQADAAKKIAKLAKLGFKQAKQKLKDAKRTARKLRKEVKALKADLAALATKKAERKPVAPKTAAKRPEPITAPPPAPVVISLPADSAPSVAPGA